MKSGLSSESHPAGAARASQVAGLHYSHGGELCFPGL